MTDYSRAMGCHIFIFKQYGYDFDEQLEQIFNTVAETGYTGIELIPPMLTVTDWKMRIDEALDRTGLELIGASIGQRFWDIENSDVIREEMDVYSDKLASFGKTVCGVTFAGKRLAERTEAENAQSVEAWIETGRAFRKKGITLMYHPHGEPAEDIRFVLDNVPAELVPLCPDIDWLRFAGIDPEGFLMDNQKRLAMIHLRDYHLEGDRTEGIGEGDADFGKLFRLLDVIGFSGRTVVELAIPREKVPARPLEKLLGGSLAYLRQVCQQPDGTPF